MKSQKEDNVWFLGGNFNSTDSSYKACRIDFFNDTFDITYIDKGLPYDFTNASICDAEGRLLCLSNGENLYHSEYEIMANGSDFYPNSNYVQGVPYVQGFMLLPLPDNPGKVVHIYGNPKVVFPPQGPFLGYVKLRYAIADMQLNNGLGQVIERDVIAGMDTLSFLQMTATRHGNGRDWWVMIPHYIDQRYYRYLLSPQGLEFVGQQSISTTTLGLGKAAFSPDGTMYARFNGHGILPDSAFSTFDLYQFDRCSGLLSNRITHTYDLSGLAGKPGGVAFSPNSRYLYVTRWDSIFQYDLQAPDIIASEVTVAVYDLFADTLGLPTRFFYPLLAPDNKIYVCVSNYNSQYLHVIEQPNSAGLACQVRQHALRLPVYNNFLLPNMPYYRLGKWVGSPCDTLGIIAVGEAPKEAGFSVFPNPASDLLQIKFSQPLRAETTVEILDLTGRLAIRRNITGGTAQFSMQTENLPEGAYFLRIASAGKLLGRQKLVVAR
ncbi:MAG: T9SS type A sorting domain-containing protein [Saprospiraceae bacterium]